MWKWILTGLVIAGAQMMAGAQDGRPLPANRAASAPTRELYRWLAARPGENGLIIGQNVNFGANAPRNYDEFFADLERQAGEGMAPALLGVDYAWDKVDAEDLRIANRVIVDHWKRGGLVTMSMHPGNPFVEGSGVRKRSPDDLRLLTRPGSAAYDRWKRDLRVVADGLTELRDAGVIVLWRPLHENNGEWFWWGDDKTPDRPEQFKVLWRDMFEYFSQARGLDNLLWVYAPNVQNGDWNRPTDHNYPGGAYVDIVGMDLYDDYQAKESFHTHNSYERLMALGKPFAITEIGPAKLKGSFDAIHVVKGIREHAPASIYALWWHSWGSGLTRSKLAIADNPNWREMLGDDGVMNLKTAAEQRPGR